MVKYTGARYHIQDDRLAEELYNKQAVKLGFPVLKEAEPQVVLAIVRFDTKNLAEFRQGYSYRRCMPHWPL